MDYREKRHLQRKPEIPGSIPGQAHFSFSLSYLPMVKQLESNMCVDYRRQGGIEHLSSLAILYRGVLPFLGHITDFSVKFNFCTICIQGGSK